MYIIVELSMDLCINFDLSNYVSIHLFSCLSVCLHLSVYVCICIYVCVYIME